MIPSPTQLTLLNFVVRHYLADGKLNYETYLSFSSIFRNLSTFVAERDVGQRWKHIYVLLFETASFTLFLGAYEMKVD